MKLQDIDFKELGLANKKKEFVVDHYEITSYKIGISKKEAITKHIKECNKKGYVPFQQTEFRKTKSSFFVNSVCIYLGKRSAKVIKTIEI